MFNSAFFSGIPAFFKDVRDRLTNLESYKTYPYVLTTGTDGSVVLDYTALKLTFPPTIAYAVELSGKTATPVNVYLVGSPTKTQATIMVSRVKSILGLNVAPAYEGVAGLRINVLVKPNTVAVT
jgi:hypothetical protein